MNLTSAPPSLRTCIEVGRTLGARREFRILSRILAVAVVVAVALGSRPMFRQVGAVGSPDPAWLGFAIGAEIASLLAYVLMSRELLRLGGGTAPVGGLLRPTLAGIAMGASLPAGVGASNVYWYKTLRRYGAERGVAALVMTGTSVAGGIALVGLLVIGVALAGGAGPLAQVHTWLLGIAALAVVLRFTLAHRLGRLLTRALRRIAPTVEPQHDVRMRRLRAIMLLAYGNWILDCTALYASLQATHAPTPARSVILVYVLAQLVAQIGFLPGGGGTVELSLAAGFAAFGHHSGAVLAGALLYRVLGCWGLVPIGWLGFILDPARANMRSLWPSERLRRRRRRGRPAVTTLVPRPLSAPAEMVDDRAS